MSFTPVEGALCAGFSGSATMRRQAGASRYAGADLSRHSFGCLTSLCRGLAPLLTQGCRPEKSSARPAAELPCFRRAPSIIFMMNRQRAFASTAALRRGMPASAGLDFGSGFETSEVGS